MNRNRPYQFEGHEDHDCCGPGHDAHVGRRQPAESVAPPADRDPRDERQQPTEQRYRLEDGPGQRAEQRGQHRVDVVPSVQDDVDADVKGGTADQQAHGEREQPILEADRRWLSEWGA